MSWLDKVNTDFVILCGGALDEDNNGTLSVGDGVKAFKPKWLNATKHIDYTIAEFNFKKVGGSLVKRGTPKGTQYNIEICFDGLDHLDIAKDFETKCGYVDPATGYAPPWRITHPYYGTLFVQPVSLTFDNTQYNVSMITGMVIETIKDNGEAFTQTDAASTITAQAAKVNAGFVRTYTADVPEPKVSDIQQIRKNMKACYDFVSGKINGVQKNVDSYLQIYNQANALVNSAIYDTNRIISQAQNLIGTPAYFADTLVNRLAMFEVQATLLNREVARILALQNRPTKTLKRLYENNAGTNIIGMCLSTINNITNDFVYRPDVLSIIGTLVRTYNQYLVDLYTLQSPNGGDEDSYVPNADDITGLHLLVNLTTSTLFNVSAASKQQRIKTLVYDSNIILVAHELYGLKQDDSTILNLIANNNIGLNEVLRLKAGRQIVYYV